jgi:hypothetical protein
MGGIRLWFYSVAIQSCLFVHALQGLIQQTAGNSKNSKRVIFSASGRFYRIGKSKGIYCNCYVKRKSLRIAITIGA